MITKLQPEKREKVTISDVARKSGVSPATVSLALRNKPGVGQETRRRIFENAKALGYSGASTQTETLTRVGTIGLIIKLDSAEDTLTNNFYTPVLAGIEAACRLENINLLYAHLLVDQDNQPLEAPQLLREQQARGLLFVGAFLNQPTLNILQQQDIPIVLVDAYAFDDQFDSVVSDNEAGAYQATAYLIAQGHCHIAIAGSLPHAYPSIQGRRTGYLNAMKAHGLPPQFLDSHLDGGEAAVTATQFLQANPEVTAVFCCNDEIAIGVMNAARSLGKHIPQDLSVIGFDDIVLAQHVSPPLTTMRVDKRGMGRLATQLLLNRIRFPQMGRVQTVVRPYLVERDSVTRIP